MPARRVTESLKLARIKSIFLFCFLHFLRDLQQVASRRILLHISAVLLLLALLLIVVLLLGAARGLHGLFRDLTQFRQLTRVLPSLLQRVFLDGSTCRDGRFVVSGEACLPLIVHVALDLSPLRHNLVEAQEWWRDLVMMSNRILIADVSDIVPGHPMQTIILLLAEVHPGAVHLLSSDLWIEFCLLSESCSADCGEFGFHDATELFNIVILLLLRV